MIKKPFRYLAKFLIFLLTFMSFAVSVYGESSTGAFLDLGVGAKGSGLGGALSAATGEVSCIYYNPAGLSYVKRDVFLASHKSLSLDRKQSAIGYARKLDPDAAFGIIWLRAGTDLDKRDINGEKVGTASDSENVVIFSFSRGLWRKISIGLSGKYIWKEFAGQKASGFGFDCGVNLRVFEDLTLGLLLSNLHTEISWRVKEIWERDSSRDEEIPLVLSCGLQYSLFEDRLSIFGDILENGSESLQLRCGADFRINGSLSLRAGIKDITGDRDLSFGGTFGLPEPFERFDLGYAFFDDAIDAGYGHEVSLWFRL